MCKFFFILSCCDRCSMNLDLNSVPLSELKICGNPNLNIFSENKCTATVNVFLSGMGMVIR